MSPTSQSNYPHKKQWKSHVYKMLWSIVDLIYPPYCAGCENPGSRWCEDCEKNVQILETEICQTCGDLIKPGQTFCKRCLTEPPPVEMLRSWGVYKDPLRKAIHQFKFKNDLSLGETFSRYLHTLLNNNQWEIDIIIPVPLHAGHGKERGYNQAAMLAFPLALAVDKKYHSRALRWSKETNSQLGLTLSERKANVKDAFIADSSIIKDKKVLIIDDIVTTGSTIFECAAACKKAGAIAVYGLTLARAVSVREPERQENK